MQTFLVLAVLLTACAAAAPGATHTIVNAGITFSPDNIEVAPGDTVHWLLGSIHNAAQVTHETWLANGTTSNGGFLTPFGGGTVVLNDTGLYYYVCQNHGPMGMKGIIHVTPPAFLPNSITVESIVDQDRSLSTTGDRMFKNWSLKLYKDSVGSGIVLESVTSGSSLTADNLAPGTYVAAEADSVPWSHISVSVDGVSQGQTAVNQRSITVASGENHTIDFINFARHTIISSSVFTFVPDSLAIPPGDTVHFVLDTMHTAREVDQSTWLANDTTPNGGFDLPVGGGSIVLSALGTHYYICVPHGAGGMKGRIVVAPADAFFTVTRDVSAGWNMVSLPAEAADSQLTTLFPTALSRAFAYEGSYSPQSTLSRGGGYWLKFGDNETASVTGFPIVRDTIDGVKGWNLIGSIAFRRPSATLSSLPPGIVNSPLFGFNGSYSIADTIVPGFGYWVRLSGQGKLILDTSSSAALPRTLPDERFLWDGGRLLVRDAADRKATLYLVETGAAGAPEPYPGELPPVPPPGAFDVRFASGRSLKSIGADESGELPILISSASYPVTVSWEMHSIRRDISLTIDGKAIGLNGSGTARIAGPAGSVSLSIRKSGIAPAAYALFQAFPNPFNPSTIIGYSLPVESRVTLRVYNILGQLVATLVDAVEAAGEKSLAWNASDKVSGIYFVQLNAAATGGPAQSFTKVIRTILQK